MAGVKIPSINQIMTLAITLMVLLFILRIAPLPEQFKNLFRI